MPITGEDLENVPIYTIGRGIAHSEVITKGPDIDRGRYDQFGTYSGEVEWRIGTLYLLRDDTGSIIATVFNVEGDWTDEAIEAILPDVLADVPYLEDELPVTVYQSEARHSYTLGFEEMEEVRQNRLIRD